MSWSHLGRIVLPFSAYVLAAMFLLNSVGFWQLLNPIYSVVAGAALHAQTALAPAQLLALLAAIRFLTFTGGFALLYSPVLLFTRRPSQVALLALLGSLPAAFVMLLWPRLLYAMSGNAGAQVIGILAVAGLAAVVQWRSRARELAANNSSKPTPLRGAA